MKRYFRTKEKRWCVVSPNGTLMPETVARTAGDAFFMLFDGMPESFQKKYWHRSEASEKAYKRMGYKAIRVMKTVEIKEIT